MFSKLLVYLCQVSNDDGPYPIVVPDNGETKSIRNNFIVGSCLFSLSRWYKIS